MNEKQSDTKETPIEELQCHKKYVYDTGIIFECKNNCKSEIIGEDVVDLLNVQHEDILFKIKLLDSLQNAIGELKDDLNSLKEENEQLKKDVVYWKKQAKQCPIRSCSNCYYIER